MRHTRSWMFRFFLAVVALFGSLTAAEALPLPGGAPKSNTDGAPDIYEVLNLLTGSSFTSNAELPTALAADETFVFGPTAGAVLMSSAARFSNDFGFYTDPGTGSALNEVLSDVTGYRFHGAPFVFLDFGLGVATEVGFYLDANGKQVWHSQSDLDTADTEVDHLVAYALGDVQIAAEGGTAFISNAILLGWEDLNPGDADFDDLVAVVGNIAFIPIPEAAPALGLGGGLAALAIHRRRRRSGVSG